MHASDHNTTTPSDDTGSTLWVRYPQVRRAYRSEDDNCEKQIAALSELTPADLGVNPQFWLEGQQEPYASVVDELRGVSEVHSVTTRRACMCTGCTLLYLMHSVRVVAMHGGDIH